MTAAMLPRRRLAGLLIGFVVFWFVIGSAYLVAFRPQRAHPVALYGHDHNITKPQIDWQRDDFVNAAVKTSIDKDYDDSDIRALCKAQTWDEKVVFNCDKVQGGIANVRQEIYSCIRYAIDAGAGFIVPIISQRADDDLQKLLGGTSNDLGYLFDRDLFVSRIKNACPEMRIFNDLESVEKLGLVVKVAVAPRDLPQKENESILSLKPRIAELHAESPGKIIVIAFGVTLAYFPICEFDSVLFANNFGRLLEFRADAQRLAATALYELSTRYRLDIDPRLAIAPNAFLGLHLRTSADALALHWTSYQDQLNHYLPIVQSSKPKVIYVASGNLSSVSHFAHKVSPVDVVTKIDLLSGTDLKALNALNWDQQALVDYLILLRSSYFSGITDSSFAWNIAIRRRVEAELGTCAITKPQKKNGIWAMRDEYSDILGDGYSAWELTGWP